MISKERKKWQDKFDILNEQKQETEQENLFKEDVVYPEEVEE